VSEKELQGERTVQTGWLTHTKHQILHVSQSNTVFYRYWYEWHKLKI